MILNQENLSWFHSFHADYLKHLPKDSDESKDTESEWH